jgi:hypothetical protein
VEKSWSPARRARPGVGRTYRKAPAISSRPRRARGYVRGKRSTNRAMKGYEQPIRWRRTTAGLIGNARPRTSSVVGETAGASQSALRYPFGETRVGLLALLTLMVPSGLRSGGVVMAKFSGHDATFRSSPTVLADTPTSSSTSTCIRSGQPSRSVCSEAIFFTLYRTGTLLPGRMAGPPTSFAAGWQAEDRFDQP